MKILVFGKNGQVALKLEDSLKEFNVDFIPRIECDFANSKNVEIFLSQLNYKPDIIINTSAYTDVENAESNFDLANEINAESVKKIAEFCKVNDIILIHYSTDYVFNGKENILLNEDDFSNLSPLNKYGITKLNGEQYIKNICNKYYIIRISWIYSENGKNFFLSMVKLLQEKIELNIVSDQVGCPTYSNSVANITKIFIQKKPNYGIYHFAENGFISWYDFSLLIKKKLTKYGFILKNEIINPILTSEYKNTKVNRSLNSRFDLNKIKKKLNIKLNNIEDSLEECIKQYMNKYDK